MMPAKPITRTTRTGTPAGWLLRYLEGKGISANHICQGLNLDEANLLSDSGIMATRTFLELLCWAEQRLHIPLIGARLAEDVNPGEYGIIGHLVLNGPSLRESFSFLERYHCIFSADFDFQITYSGSIGKCRYQAAVIDGADSRIDIDFGLALVIKALREYAGAEWQPLRCRFTYPGPEDTREHRAYYGDSLYFNQPENSVEFELDLLDIPNSRADPYLLPILLNQANQLLDKLQEQNDIVHQVRLLIMTSLGYTAVTTERVAERLNVSVRHLHRRLADRNSSFRTIKEETVLQVAKEALIESDLSITQIALKLSYSETSALDRMFKKHVGITPLQYRKQFSTFRSPT